MARLGDYITQVRGVSYKPEDVCDSSVKESIPIFRANNIQDDGLTFNDLVYVRTTRVSREQLIRAGDIVVCSSSGSRALVGKAAISKKDLQMSFGAFCKVIRTSKMNAEYLGYFFQSPIYRNRIAEVSGGANINNIRNEHINDIPFMVIDEETQSLAVEIFNKVTDLITLRKQQLAKLDEIVKSQFIEMFGDSMTNPMEWSTKNFEDICEIITDGEHATPRRVEKGIYLLSARNVLNHVLRLDDVDFIDEDEFERIGKRIMPQADDILISCSGSIGRCCKVPKNLKFQMVRSVALLRFKSCINPTFAEYMITSNDLTKQIENASTKSSQANLFQGRIRKLRGYLPPLDLQNQFEDFVRQVDKSKFEIQKSLETLETLKKALMQQYFG